MEQQLPNFFDRFFSIPDGSFMHDDNAIHDQDDRGFIMDLPMESADFTMETWLTDSPIAYAPYHSTTYPSTHGNHHEQAGKDNLRHPSSPDPLVKRRKKKAPTLRVSDWEPHKARIIELHVTQKRSLPEVKALIKRVGLCRRDSPVPGSHNLTETGQKHQARRDTSDSAEAATQSTHGEEKRRACVQNERASGGGKED